MSAQHFTILARQKMFPASVVSFDDFTLSKASTVDPDLVIRDPDWSLYAIDIAKDQAMFVQTPAGTDLAEAPFVYGAQFELAQKVITVPLDQLSRLAELVTPPPGLGILFSTGRCGSTLASRILAQIPDVWSLSEPDALNNLAFARFEVPRERMVQLIAASVRLLSRPPAGRDISTVVIKPRSESVVQAPEYAEALPNSRNIFMYRDAEKFVNSLYRFAQRMMGPEMFGTDLALQTAWALSSVNAPQSLKADFFDVENEDVRHLETMVMGWVLRIRAYRAAVAQGLTILPLHYDDLNRDRREQTALMLSGFGISGANVELAMRAFDRDAHAGTAGENAVPADPIDVAQERRIAELLDRWGEDQLSKQRL